LTCTLPATFPVPTELALLLITTAPGTIGATSLGCGTFTPVPIVPFPATMPVLIILEPTAVLAVPTGGGVGVATLTACPEALVCADACPANISTPKSAQKKIVPFNMILAL
jgi:hypothetical protein